jgi:class 3 adenylate cyclase
VKPAELLPPCANADRGRIRSLSFGQATARRSRIVEIAQLQQASEQTSRYFEIVRGAVAEEGGMIDKFIDDAVIAF